MVCGICPRNCGVDRKLKKGFCGAGEKPAVAGAFLHMWEEPCISGTNGSGTVFFSGCNLRCVFCQNHEISRGGSGREVSTEELAGIFLSLRDRGAHNINLVTPSHFAPAIKEALEIAKAGKLKSDDGDMRGGKPLQPAKPLDIPVVYNTNAYDSLETLRELDGYVDIYLPDLKYISPEISMEYSGAKDYFDAASKAVIEMSRQAGEPVFDENGLMKRGIIVRHLVLPGHIAETLRILEWIAGNLPRSVYVSLMSQYIPCHDACGHPVLGRRITRHEYEKAVNKFIKLGLNGFVQERESASAQYVPDFGRMRH